MKLTDATIALINRSKQDRAQHLALRDENDEKLHRARDRYVGLLDGTIEGTIEDVRKASRDVKEVSDEYTLTSRACEAATQVASR